MRATLILTGLLLVGALVAVPGATAIPHPCDSAPAANETCWVAADGVALVAGYVYCYYYTAPYQWAYTCV